MYNDRAIYNFYSPYRYKVTVPDIPDSHLIALKQYMGLHDDLLNANERRIYFRDKMNLFTANLNRNSDNVSSLQINIGQSNISANVSGIKKLCFEAMIDKCKNIIKDVDNGDAIRKALDLDSLKNDSTLSVQLDDINKKILTIKITVATPPVTPPPTATPPATAPAPTATLKQINTLLSLDALSVELVKWRDAVKSPSGETGNGYAEFIRLAMSTGMYPGGLRGPPIGMYPGGPLRPPIGMYPGGPLRPPIGMYPGGLGPGSILPPIGMYPQPDIPQILFFNDESGKNTNIKDNSKKSFSTETAVSLYKFLTEEY